VEIVRFIVCFLVRLGWLGWGEVCWVFYCTRAVYCSCHKKMNLAFNPSCNVTSRFPKNDSYERRWCEVVSYRKTKKEEMVIGDVISILLVT